MFESVDIPSDFVSHSLKGVSFRIPSDWEAHSAIKGAEPGSYRSDDKSSIVVISYNYKEEAEREEEYKELLGDEYDENKYDLWEAYKYKEADYRHFYKSIGTELPQYGLPTRLFWYIREGFTAKDCLKLRGKDKDVFLELAQNKEEATEMENLAKIKGSDFSEYVGQIMYDGYDGNFWNVTLFPESDENQYYMVMVKCPDETIAKQIVSSIELE